MQCAWAVLSSVSCPAIYYFSILSEKRHDFSNKGTEHKTRVLIFSSKSAKIFFILTRTERDVIKNVCCFPCKVSVILVIDY